MAAALKIDHSKFDIESFLIYLAQNADPKRFTPFPEFYRTSPRITDDQLAKYEEKQGKSLRQIRREALPSEFDEYTDEEFKRLKADLNNIHSEKSARLKEYILNVDIGMVEHRHGAIDKSITEYEFQYPYIDEYIRNIHFKKRWYLFHGSKLGNWHSILRTGIKNMSGTRFMSAGAAYGNGVYLSDDFNISVGYGVSHTDKAAVCVAVVELLEDPNAEEIINNKSHKKYFKQYGYYVVPDASILFPRYLLVSKNMIAVKDINTILADYKTFREVLINPKPKIARIRHELKEISEYVQKAGDKVSADINPSDKKTNDNYITVLVRNTLYRIYLEAFPTKCPLVQFVYEPASELEYKCQHTDTDSAQCQECQPDPILMFTSIHKKYILECDFTKWTFKNTLMDIIKELKKINVIMSDKLTTPL